MNGQNLLLALGACVILFTALVDHLGIADSVLVGLSLFLAILAISPDKKTK